MILGIGIDIIEIRRFDKSIKKTGGKILKRLFTITERNYCESKKQKSLHYAARFCAKEAFLKALGTGLDQKISWQDISVENSKDGRSKLAVSGEALKVSKKFGVRKIHLSISHSHDFATAVVVLEK